MTKKVRKKIRNRFFICLLACLLYLTLGALLPFVSFKNVNQDFAEAFDKNLFYGDGTGSPDRAAIIETSGEALTARLEMIETAKEKIVLSTFDIREGESTSDVFAALLSAADRGVKVEILVDGMYGGLHMAGRTIFYAVGNHPNVEIRFYNIPNLLKPWSINGRMHDKYLLVDDRLLMLGGRNTFDYFLGEYSDKNLSYDRDVLVYNSAYQNETNKTSVIFSLMSYFEKVWNSEYCETVFDKEKKGKSIERAEAAELLKQRHAEGKGNLKNVYGTDEACMEKTVETDKITLITNPIHTLAKEPYVWYQLQRLMENAKEKVTIHTPYAAFSDDMYEGMRRISERVESFDMILNSVAVGDNVMASSDYIWNKKKILKTGVKVKEFHGEQSSHGKSILIDNDLSVIGSFNLDMRSTYVDTEVMLVIHGTEFNRLLEEKIKFFIQQSIEVNDDGTYVENSDIQPIKLPAGKAVLFRITSAVFQLFRYLI